MLEVGRYNTLKILRFTSVGAYLGDDEDNDVLLPNKYLTPDMKEEEDIEVFLYRDSEDRIVATTETPKICCGEFGYLSVKEVNLYGAFLDWGLEKDLMVPFKEQNQRMEENRSYLVTLQRDDATDRLYASMKVNKYLQKCEHSELKGRMCSCLIGETTDLGVKVIVDHCFHGLIYRNELSMPLKKGQFVSAYIAEVRPDGKLDITLHAPGVKRYDDATGKLRELLETDKVVYLSDKSDPDEIREMVGMSKKLFKQTIGKLYKEKFIQIYPDRIELVEK